MTHTNLLGRRRLWPFLWRSEEGLRPSHMAVAYGIAYSLYRSHPKVPIPADVPQGCWGVNVLGKGKVGKEEVETGVEYAGAL